MRRHLQILDYALGACCAGEGRVWRSSSFMPLPSALWQSILFLTRALRVEAVQLLEHAPELIVQRTMAGRHELIPADYAAAIRGIPESRRSARVSGVTITML